MEKTRRCAKEEVSSSLLRHVYVTNIRIPCSSARAIMDALRGPCSREALALKPLLAPVPSFRVHEPSKDLPIVFDDTLLGQRGEIIRVFIH